LFRAAFLRKIDWKYAVQHGVMRTPVYLKGTAVAYGNASARQRESPLLVLGGRLEIVHIRNGTRSQWETGENLQLIPSYTRT
jgi:hypothetical protein